jgi:hypothetical protein
MIRVAPFTLNVTAFTSLCHEVRAGSRIVPEPIRVTVRFSFTAVCRLTPLPAFTFTVPIRVGGWSVSATAGTVSGLSPPLDGRVQKFPIVSRVGANHAPTRVEGP